MAWWLLSSLPPLSKTAEEITARQGALQIALTAGAGIGAVITVMLAFRRQRHQELTALITSRQADRNAELAERVAEHNRQDAAERRVTELYTKAVEQLGSAKAAVRLGGMYALERLAQGNSEHRQTIVNVICSYLRMPYTVPGTAAPGSQPPGPHHSEADSIDAEGERQVRLTAQHILAEHLRDGRSADQRDTVLADPNFWEGMRIDLTGAVLINFDFDYCHVAQADFTKATFVESAGFRKANFNGYSGFKETTFSDYAQFFGATFNGFAQFVETTFSQYAGFDGVTFGGFTQFQGTTFGGEARFFGATFSQYAGFGAVTFGGITTFGTATFIEGAELDNTRVLRSHAGHRWPADWTIFMEPDGTGVLRYDDKVSPASVPDSVEDE
ncbi:pentapeptide repeat-containing protein [Streptosporangium canum]|uniref:pentapeptide repeat-containing protein n=1 Tax=Streptosporangium canum TaxID=324952 RepID=UPI0033B93699